MRDAVAVAVGTAEAVLVVDAVRDVPRGLAGATAEEDVAERLVVWGAESTAVALSGNVGVADQAEADDRVAVAGAAGVCDAVCVAVADDVAVTPKNVSAPSGGWLEWPDVAVAVAEAVGDARGGADIAKGSAPASIEIASGSDVHAAVGDRVHWAASGTDVFFDGVADDGALAEIAGDDVRAAVADIVRVDDVANAVGDGAAEEACDLVVNLKDFVHDALSTAYSTQF